MRRAALLFAFLLALPLAGAAEARLKELASIEGVRDNQLIGYGLVVGLNGTGDRRQTIFSAQSLTNMLQRMGVSVNPNLITVKNTAAVMVAATLRPFAQPGETIDVTVASVGDASTLQGGLLVLTSLKGADGQVYAVAQGSVVTGGYAVGGVGTAKVLNHPTAGLIPGGAIVERPAPSPSLSGRLRLELRQMDFTTASRVAAAINTEFGSPAQPVALAVNGRVVAVSVPPAWASHPADFVAQMEGLTVETDRQARVVISERTGTIVMGKGIRIAPVAIMHGNLSVEVQTTFTVSQPAPFSRVGSTQVVPQVQVGAGEEKARNVILNDRATVEDLVQALNAIGSTPRDIIAVLEALRAAGAIEASVEVI